MVVSPYTLIFTASASLLFGSTLLGGLVIQKLIHEEREKRTESRRRSLAAFLDKKPDKNSESIPRASRTARLCSDPLNSEIISVFDASNKLIYSLQKKSLSSQNVWILINQYRNITGELSLTPGYLLSTAGRKQVAKIELMDSILGLRTISLKRRLFPGDSSALDFEYLGAAFSWNKRNQNLTATSPPSLQASNAGNDDKTDTLNELNYIAVCKSLKQVGLDYEVCYDSTVIDDEAMIATCFVAIMTPWEPSVSLSRLVSLIKSAPTENTTF